MALLTFIVDFLFWVLTGALIYGFVKIIIDEFKNRGK